MIKIETSVLINRPVNEVFAYVANLENGQEWQTDVQELRQTSEGPMGVGTVWHEVRQLLGRLVEQSNKMTQYEPNKKFAYRQSGTVPVEAMITFESVAEGETKVTMTGEAEPGGFFKLAEPLVAQMAKRQTEANAANLKDILEAQA